MFKILLFAVLVTLFIIMSARYKKMDAAQKRKTLWRLLTGAFLGVLVLLVISGRLHWVGAALGALLPFLRTAYSLVSQVLPYWLKHKKAQHTPQDEVPVAPPTSAMSTEEAINLLGLKGDITKGDITTDMVVEAHRHLIQKIHPDRGGNDYLAAKINQARDLLISELSQQ